MFANQSFGLNFDPYPTVRFHLNLGDLSRADDDTIFEKRIK